MKQYGDTCKKVFDATSRSYKHVGNDGRVSSTPEPRLVEGVVDEALPNTLFRVKTEDGETILAYLAGKMRLHRIRVLVGDKVSLQLDPYGGRARIVRRA